MAIFAVVAILLSLSLAAVLPSPDTFHYNHNQNAVASARQANIPLLIWHGLGDAFDADGIKAVGDIYKELYSGSFVYPIHIGDNGDADRHASFFGNLTEQVATVCEDIKNVKEITESASQNAIGFSQGGVFLRGLIERCDAINVETLVTFGSPHSGITRFAACGDSDWWCKIWSGTLRSNTWGSFAQGSLIPAQYFRDPEDIENFLEYSNFLADVNNERKNKQDAYKSRITDLTQFVMFKFQDENVIHPPESSWFADSNTTSGLLTRLKERDLYKEEWLGLKKLDEKGGLVFRTTPGEHMQIADGVLEDTFRRYFTPSDPVRDSLAELDRMWKDVTSAYGSENQQSVLSAEELCEIPQQDMLEPQTPDPRVFLWRYERETASTFN